jgi:hypothetical protein
MSVYTIVYRSAPLFAGSIAAYLLEIDSILATARRRNAEVSVTGAMLFNEDWFVQLLEGDETAVREIFGRIAVDPRHEEVEILFRSFTENRRFPEWSMAFVGHAEAVRKRFADSPLATPGVKMRGQQVVDFMVELAVDELAMQ